MKLSKNRFLTKNGNLYSTPEQNGAPVKKKKKKRPQFHPYNPGFDFAIIEIRIFPLLPFR